MSQSHIPDLVRMTESQISEEKTWRAITAAILEWLPDAIVVTDGDGKIVRVNGQTELMFGYHRSEIHNQQVEILLPDSLREMHKSHRAKYLQEPRPRIMGAGRQVSGRRKNGSEFPADISLSPVMTEQGLFVVVIIRRTRESVGTQG